MKLITDDTHVLYLLFCEKSKRSLCGSYLEKQVKQYLEAYFSRENFITDIPLKLNGTVFQMKAWEVLKTVEYGKTISYQQQLERIGYRNGTQAIGQANKKNPIQILIPCHRVIASNGSLGGYAAGLNKKIWLLSHEQH